VRLLRLLLLLLSAVSVKAWITEHDESISPAFWRMRNP